MLLLAACPLGAMTTACEGAGAVTSSPESPTRTTYTRLTLTFVSHKLTAKLVRGRGRVVTLQPGTLHSPLHPGPLQLECLHLRCEAAPGYRGRRLLGLKQRFHGLSTRATKELVSVSP